MPSVMKISGEKQIPDEILFSNNFRYDCPGQWVGVPIVPCRSFPFFSQEKGNGKPPIKQGFCTPTEPLKIPGKGQRRTLQKNKDSARKGKDPGTDPVKDLVYVFSSLLVFSCPEAPRLRQTITPRCRGWTYKLPGGPEIWFFPLFL